LPPPKRGLDILSHVCNSYTFPLSLYAFNASDSTPSWFTSFVDFDPEKAPLGLSSSSSVLQPLSLVHLQDHGRVFLLFKKNTLRSLTRKTAQLSLIGEQITTTAVSPLRALRTNGFFFLPRRTFIPLEFSITTSCNVFFRLNKHGPLLFCRVRGLTPPDSGKRFRPSYS